MKNIILLCGILVLSLSHLALRLNLEQTRVLQTQATEISYLNAIKPIIETHCISCHSSKDSFGGFSLASYEALKLSIQNKDLLTRINDINNPMPPQALMSKKQRKLIRCWADNGFKKGDSILYQGYKKDNYNPDNMSDNNNCVLESSVEPLDIDKQGFEFLSLMQGHWVGEIMILGQYYEWFSFDYRPISSSHIHGIYEGGTIGNLFTSFFVTNFNNTKTLMARNGGVLNGIYRTSYFVLDKAELYEDRKCFRFVDAYGAEDIMWMELVFIKDKLIFTAYTSRFGSSQKPSLHMKFTASRKHIEISKSVADDLGYPQNKIDIDFSNGLPLPDWGKEYTTITSATYIYTDQGQGLEALAERSKDPYTISNMPYVSQLKVEIEQNQKIKDQKLIIYLSKQALTDDKGIISEYGYVKESLFDGVFLFPNIEANHREFTFIYLHPGDYFITLVADVNKDGYISRGDITSKSLAITIAPKSKSVVKIDDITQQN